MVNNSTKGKLFAILCIVLIAFGCSSASNLVFGEVFSFNELIPINNSKMNIIKDNEFNPIYLVNHKEVYVNKVINKTNITNTTYKTKNYNKTKYYSNKTKNYNKTKLTNNSKLI